MKVPEDTDRLLGGPGFEQGQPQPDWTSTVETGPDGRPKAKRVTGPTPTGLPGDLTSHVTDVAASGNNPPKEIAENLPDGDPYSKWLTFESTGWVTYAVDEPLTVKAYALTSANDAPERDPKNWVLQGSNDGGAWTTLDTRSDQDFAEREQMRTFGVAGDTAYTHFRLGITANHGADIVQLADWLIGDGSPAEGPHGPMVTEAGGGPTSAYNAKTKVGFTGVKSLHYAGRTSAKRGGYSWEKVLKTDVRVEPSTQLSYTIFPELTAQDLHYPSTYAAVDLHFTDGTYLSDLGARDQLGFELSPRGQGESKALYADQWNARQSWIGEVAAGKTIDRILGKARNAAYLDHDDIAQGGTIDFTMSSTPNRWATGRAGAPPSITVGHKVPEPELDLTGNGAGQAGGAADAGKLFDNTSLTEASVPVGDSVTYHFDQPKKMVTRYTLTSGTGTAPTGWRLEGSRDGEKWRTIDEHSDESFTWERQTRPFDVHQGGRFQYFRLTVTGAEGGPASLAEIELMGK